MRADGFPEKAEIFAIARYSRWHDCGSDPPASVEFGRFRVLPHRRELLADGQPVKLGGRAFDVFMALIEAHGAVVTKDALMQRVWDGRIVEENNLQSHMSALRAVLGPGPPTAT